LTGVKFGQLKAIGHNLADSLASGNAMMVGFYDLNVFEEASNSSEGFIVVDFLAGATEGAQPSARLANAIARFREALPEFFEREGADLSDVACQSARFALDRVYGRHFTVTVEDRSGRRSVDRYLGTPGRRIGRRT
jgi:hypothetical protein